MYSESVRKGCALLVGMAVMMDGLATALWAGPVSLAQATGKAAETGEKELDAAVQKIREGRNDEALALIREKAAKHPEWSPAPLILARILLGAGQAAPGRHYLERAAIEAPKHPDVYLTFGSMAVSDGRFSDARLNFQTALDLIGSGQWDAEKVRMFRREALSGLSAVAEAREDWKTAQDDLNALLELDPKSGQARQQLARVLFRLDKTDEAFNTLKQAVLDTPALEPAAISMGRLFIQKGDAKKAEEWFDYALKVEPVSARVRIARAGWLLDQGRAPLARAEADEALKLDPKSTDAQRTKGFVAWHLRDLAGSEAILEPLHRALPNDGGTANLLALTMVEQDDPVKRARGLQLAEVNARQNPRSHDNLATLGWAHYRSGHLDQAEQLLRAASQGIRISPDLAYYLARVLADKGRTEDARRLLQGATGVTGAFAHRDEANSLLKTLNR
jgi:tetratricopeptide (TPR) repeat protein